MARPRTVEWEGTRIPIGMRTSFRKYVIACIDVLKELHAARLKGYQHHREKQ
jgi:hypothetical protein